MSYRAFKRLLGETSLERKCRFLFGGGVVVLVFLSFWLYAYLIEHLAYDQAIADCKLLVAPSLVRQHLMKAESSAKKEKDLSLQWEITNPVKQPGNLDDFILADTVKESQFYFLNANKYDDSYEQQLIKEFEKGDGKSEDSQLRTNDQALFYYA